MSKAARNRARRKTRTPVPGRIDLVEWIKLRQHCSTRQAFALLYAGILRVDSHIIGVKKEGKHKVVDRYVPASFRGRIQIVRD